MSLKLDGISITPVYSLVLFGVLLSFLWGGSLHATDSDTDRYKSICALDQKESKKEGPREFIDKHANGKLKDKIICFKDKNGGTHTSWYANTQMKGEGTFSDGELHGKWTRWFEGGKKMDTGKWKKGKPHGQWYQWHSNGKIKNKIEFEFGLKSGDFETWNDKGKILEEGSFEKNKKIGWWEEWSETDKVYKDIYYQDGVAVDKKSKYGLHLNRFRASYLSIGYIDQNQSDDLISQIFSSLSSEPKASSALEIGWHPDYRPFFIFSIGMDLSVGPFFAREGTRINLTYGAAASLYLPFDDRFLIQLGLGRQNQIGSEAGRYEQIVAIFRPVVPIFGIFTGASLGFRGFTPDGAVEETDQYESVMAGLEFGL